MVIGGRCPQLRIRLDFFVPTIVHDTNATVPKREMAISIQKPKLETVKEALTIHKTLTDLVYDHLPYDMKNSDQDNGEFPDIATMFVDIVTEHGTMPENVRKSLQVEILTPIDSDEDPAT